MKRDADICKNLYTIVLLSGGASLSHEMLSA